MAEPNHFVLGVDLDGVCAVQPGEYSDFKPLAPSSDEMWSEAGEQEAFLWFIEPD